MNTLVIVACGRYENGSLSDLGREQMTILGNQLKGIVNGKKPLILASPADNANESAAILGVLLESPPETHDILWSNDQRRPDLEGVLALVAERTKTADCAILVTHLELAEYFPEYFGDKVLGIPLQRQKIGAGQALIIDCELRRAELMRSC